MLEPLKKDLVLISAFIVTCVVVRLAIRVSMNRRRVEMSEEFKRAYTDALIDTVMGVIFWLGICAGKFIMPDLGLLDEPTIYAILIGLVFFVDLGIRNRLNIRMSADTVSTAQTA